MVDVSSFLHACKEAEFETIHGQEKINPELKSLSVQIIMATGLSWLLFGWGGSAPDITYYNSTSAMHNGNLGSH